MKKELIFILMILLVISGCQYGSRKTGLGGNPDGLNIRFLEQQPPDSIKEDGQFSVALGLVNNAECDIESGIICVEDTLGAGWGGEFDEPCKYFDLWGVEVDNGVEVDEDTITFYSSGYHNLEKDLNTEIIAKATYRCNIETGPQLCIVSNVKAAKEYGCEIRETVSGNTLGFKVAPVGVSSVDKLLVFESGGVRLYTDIHLKKMSKGKIFSDDEKLPLNINVEYLGYGMMECEDVENGVYYWENDDTEKVIKCDILVDNVDYIENPLSVELDYDYQIKESKLITIENKKKVV